MALLEQHLAAAADPDGARGGGVGEVGVVLVVAVVARGLRVGTAVGDEEVAACAGGCEAQARSLGSSDVEVRNAAMRELSVATAGVASSLLDLGASAAGGFLLPLSLLPPAVPLWSGR
jgi:hypothetical protein